MSRKKKHEAHVNHERYLVTYSDLITLLLAFFIVLYAMSSPDIKKFDNLAASFQFAFTKTSNQIIQNLNTPSQQINQPITNQQMQEIKAASENSQLRTVQAQLKKQVQNNPVLKNSVHSTLSKNGLEISLPSDFLFSSGSAKLNPAILPIISGIARSLDKLPNPIIVKGYTDNVPISTSLFPSNWELSTSRADSVVRYMLSSDPKLNPNNFSAEGFAQYHPVDTNKTSAGRAKNRRVVIFIQRLNSSGYIQPNSTPGSTNSGLLNSNSSSNISSNSISLNTFLP